MSLRRIALLIISILLIILFMQWLAHYLTFGKLIITTNSPNNTITLTASSGINSSNKSFSIQAKDSLSTSLREGGYLLRVQDSSSGETQYVAVKAHSTKRISVVLPGLKGIEPVTFDTAQDVIADNNSLVYLDSVDGSLNQINNQNQHSEVDVSSYNLKTINWADTSYGVGQNANGQLFIINNSVVSPLQSPISNQNDSGAVFAVTTSRKIYMGLGSSVYSGTENGGFKKIYNKLGVNSTLAPGLNMVGIISSGYGSGGNNSTPQITVIDSSGKQTTTKFNTPVQAWSSWSLHDKYIVVLGATSGEVLDSSLHKVAVIPEPNLSNPVWLDDNTLFYSVGDQLWSYSVQDQKSQLVASMPLGDLIQQISVSSDKAYLYLTTKSTSSTAIAIRRIGLLGQEVPAFIYQLQDILPQPSAGTGYGLGLINFSGTKPTIEVLTAYGGPVNAQQLAAQQLQSEGFDLSTLQFEVQSDE